MVGAEARQPAGGVTIDDGEISAGGVRMLPHFGGGTAFVEAGLTSGTFRSMATLMNLFQTGTVQKRELVTGSWDCG